MTRTAPAIALAALLMAGSAPAQQREPPAPDCIDARTLEQARQLDSRSLAIRTADGTRALVTTGTECPDIASHPQMRVLARGGWLCGAPGEALRSESLTCPVVGVRVVDAREYAEAIRTAPQQIGNFDPVVVAAPQQRGFAGTSDDCVRIDALRGWQEDRDGLRVEVSPRRAGGNRHYRIETYGGCGDAINADTLQLVSGMDLGMVCGNPGDLALFSRGQPRQFAGVTAFSRPTMQARLAAQYGCRISRVYPIED